MQTLPQPSRNRDSRRPPLLPSGFQIALHIDVYEYLFNIYDASQPLTREKNQQD